MLKYLLIIVGTTILMLSGVWYYSVSTEITPVAIIYAGFNNSTSTTPSISWDKSNIGAYHSDGHIEQALLIDKSSSASQLSTSAAVWQARRGTIAFWIKLNSLTDSICELISNYPGPPYIGITCKPGPNGNVTFSIGFDGSAGGLGRGVSDQFSTADFDFEVGAWHQIIWTWQGTHSKVYLDGALSTDYIMVSPMPTRIAPDFRIGAFAGGTENVSVDELGVYNYAFNMEDVIHSFNANTSAAIVASGSHGMDAVAQWAPGNGQVLIMADTGTDFATRGASYGVTILQGSTPIASASISTLTGGFGEQLITIQDTALAAGTYIAQVTLKDAGGAALASQTTAPFSVPVTSWLGNSRGVSSAVQSPWTAISVSGTALSAVGRTYTLTQGWGLPQQISSAGQNLLASAIDIDFDIGSGAFNLTPDSLSINSKADNLVTWNGTAHNNGISASIKGALEYDGMVMIELTLRPSSSPITIRTAKLQMAMPAARAVYYSYVSDGSAFDLDFDPGVPEAPGTFWTNVMATRNLTNLAPSIVLSDEDRGLEWFADNLSGWHVDESLTSSTPIQKLVVDENTNVRLEIDLITQALTLSEPVTITFGYLATPIKPLPADWRATQIGDVAGGSIFPGMFNCFWVFPGDNLRAKNWPSFWVSPRDFPAWLAAIAPSMANGRGICPYTDQHVTVASDGDPPLDFLNAELAPSNNGFNYMPSGGARDYWAYNIDNVLAARGMTNLYIDEPFPGYNISASQASGLGYVGQNLISRNGFSLSGMRKQIQRLRQVLANHGQRPLIWINAAMAGVTPHAWAFVDVSSDGEAITFPTNASPDPIDRYGTTKGIHWLRGISRAQKYGMSTAFQNKILFSVYDPAYIKYWRALVALLQLMDINPQGSYHSFWQQYQQPRVNFGITATDVIFRGYWEQTAVSPKTMDAHCSYYGGANKVLVHCANLAGTTDNDTIAFNAGALGLRNTVTAIDAESGNRITITDDTFPLSINSHDYRVVQLSGS